MITWDQLIASLDRPGSPDVLGAYVTMACSAMAYLPAAQVAAPLKLLLGADSVERVGGGSDFIPHVLVCRGPAQTLVAVEGTRTWIQWATYATEAGWTTWPTGPGEVYSAFYVLWNTLRPIWVNLLAENKPLYFAGHSLGAAVAALAARQAQDVGATPRVVHSFGAPRCVSQEWVRAYRATTWSLNHPLDPVPRAPTDAIAACLYGSIFSTPRSGASPAGANWTLQAWAQLGIGNGPFDTLSAYAAATAAPSQSPHQTYRYLRDLDAVLTGPVGVSLFELRQFVSQLGLLNPWPA